MSEKKEDIGSLIEVWNNTSIERSEQKNTRRSLRIKLSENEKRLLQIIHSLPDSEGKKLQLNVTSLIKERFGLIGINTDWLKSVLESLSKKVPCIVNEHGTGFCVGKRTVLFSITKEKKAWTLTYMTIPKDSMEILRDRARLIHKNL